MSEGIPIFHQGTFPEIPIRAQGCMWDRQKLRSRGVESESTAPSLSFPLAACELGSSSTRGWLKHIPATSHNTGTSPRSSGSRALPATPGPATAQLLCIAVVSSSAPQPQLGGEHAHPRQEQARFRCGARARAGGSYSARRREGGGQSC